MKNKFTIHHISAGHIDSIHPYVQWGIQEDGRFIPNKNRTDMRRFDSEAAAQKACDKLNGIKTIANADLPHELWVMAYHTATMAGSVSHVSGGEKFYRTQEECQAAIDGMRSWLGMGNRNQYRPICLVSSYKKEEVYSDA